ncbi:N-acyl-D-amino-acid deacylase family protein [Lederbergia citrea]|uniref:N-acyl-D-amino-acid deacylase family protein n=1 Tax=Lederbergia citrea TaxID=2833581 RepID=UPI001BC92D02|nr:D-aminoacylase [Lederbergia citrea]MBS4204511.1 D-aminoacylase [Lederbergia citrea]
MLDIIIKNGKIVDGSGNPWFYGDVAIKDGKIVKVGYVDQESHQVVDAKRQVISPGFIDGHCHSDLMILNYPDSEIKLQQGVTTEVVGNCGLSPAPFFGEYKHLLQEYVQPVIGSSRNPWSWKTVDEYVAAIGSARPSENISTYVAHGTLRILVMGFEKRQATKDEIERMKVLLEEGLKAGAIGLSIGLLYAPGSYSSKEEIAELCSILPKYNGLFSTHIRGEGNSLISSIKEVIWIAQTAGVPLHISHLKAAGKRNWGLVQEAMEVITDAREKGLDVTCDVYPYSASSTMLLTVLPPWVLEGGVQHTLERFKDREIRKKIREELSHEQTEWDNLVCSTGWENVVISSVQTDKNRSLEGKNIAEISEIRGTHPVDCVLDLLSEEGGNVSIVYFLMSDDDVSQVIRWDHSLIASDSLHCDTGKPHPRLYGSFPRVFAKYVRDDGLLSLEQAVRKITSFPVRRFKLGNRGLIVPGYAADLVVFNPDTIQDEATYQNPKKYPNGISHVWVNGKMTMENGVHTKAREGVFIHCCH